MATVPDATMLERFDLGREPLSADLARLLAGEIVRGTLEPGLKLVETDICERYGVSRSPLREALGTLETWGLVVRRPRYGVRVAPLSLENLDDITICRIPLEARAAALVAALPERLDIAERLTGHIGRMHQAMARGDFDACFTANLDLIDHLHRANPNPVLRRLLAELNLPAQRYRYLVYRHQPETLRMLIASNETMIAAIRDGAAAHAHDITETMVREAWQDLRTVLSALIPHSQDPGTRAGDSR